MALKHNWQRVKRDGNGNSRYKVHFSVFVPDMNPSENSRQVAVERARAIGGKPYRAKWHRDYIVFQSCSLPHTEQAIDEMLKKVLPS